MIWTLDQCLYSQPKHNFWTQILGVWSLQILGVEIRPPEFVYLCFGKENSQVCIVFIKIKSLRQEPTVQIEFLVQTAKSQQYKLNSWYKLFDLLYFRERWLQF